MLIFVFIVHASACHCVRGPRFFSPRFLFLVVQSSNFSKVHLFFHFMIWSEAVVRVAGGDGGRGRRGQLVPADEPVPERWRRVLAPGLPWLRQEHRGHRQVPGRVREEEAPAEAGWRGGTQDSCSSRTAEAGLRRLDHLCKYSIVPFSAFLLYSVFFFIFFIQYSFSSPISNHIFTWSSLLHIVSFFFVNFLLLISCFFFSWSSLPFFV